MTIRWPPGRLLTLQHPCAYPRHSFKPIQHVCSFQIRQYASQSPRPSSHTSSQTKSNTNASNFDVQSALQTVRGNIKLDPLNPPPSTRPPPLHLPTRGPENVFAYYWSIGRAYGTFYKNGIKSVWYNYRACILLSTRLKETYKLRYAEQALGLGKWARSEYVMDKRSSQDVGKLPVFGLLVLVFGEWLPLLVPFIPNAVPSTCRIPKQVEGMRRRTEERRRISFRSGVDEPSREQIANAQENARRHNSHVWYLDRSKFRDEFARSLHPDQIHHLSTTFNLHGSLWDRLNLRPPTILSRARLAAYIKYLITDDFHLSRFQSFDKLHPEELLIACEQRGIDVLGRSEETLRKLLTMWVDIQWEDRGSGTAFLMMSFRRPSVWKDVQAELKRRKLGS